MEREEKTCRGRELSWLWHGEKGEEGRPLLVCLASDTEEAEACLGLLKGQAEGALLAAAVIPGGDLGPVEEALGDLLYSWKQEPGVEETRVSLTGSTACADAVWQLASHFPQWFSAVCAVGGRADPYEARALRSVPLRTWAFPGEDCGRKAGRVLTDVRRTVMGLRTAGAEQAECTDLPRGMDREAAWPAVFGDGSAARWMLSQDRRRQFEVTWIKPGVWRIDDYFTASCYLVEGTEKALLIDTGMGEGDLPGLVRRLTRLPVELAVTHPHGDHMYRADRFSRVYLHENDIARLRADPDCFRGAFPPDCAARPELVPIREGSRIALGGGVEMEVLELGGHTPDSVVFADDAHRALFTGDAIGSGYIALMICPEAELLDTVRRYGRNLEGFFRHLPRVREYAWLGGHAVQENGCDLRRQPDCHAGRSSYFNPIREEVARDMLALCERILSGEVTREAIWASREHYCCWGSAGMYFRFI